MKYKVGDRVKVTLKLSGKTITEIGKIMDIVGRDIKVIFEKKVENYFDWWVTAKHITPICKLNRRCY